MVYLDTVSLLKPLMMFTIFRGIFLFLALANPVNVVVFVLYVMAIKSLFGSGEYFRLIFIAMIIDIVTIFVVNFDNNIFVILFLVVPIILMLLTSLVINRSLELERQLFNRTILSFNRDDKIRARKAMISLDPVDISEVAAYKNWANIGKS